MRRSAALGVFPGSFPGPMSCLFEKVPFFRQHIDEFRQISVKFGFYASSCVECADRQLWAIFLAHFPDCLGLSLTFCLVLVTDFVLAWSLTLCLGLVTDFVLAWSLTLSLLGTLSCLEFRGFGNRVTMQCSEITKFARLLNPHVCVTKTRLLPEFLTFVIAVGDCTEIGCVSKI